MNHTVLLEKPLQMTQPSIAAFLEQEKAQGTSRDCLRQRKTHVTGLFAWLPEDKLLTLERLQAWRSSMEKNGCSKATVLNYVKSVNRYLDYCDRSDLRFNKGRAKDLTGKEYGFLTALENTGTKDRGDFVWKCRCRCGKEVCLPATRLLTGNTLSCGCLQARHLRDVNQYIDNTSLRSALEDTVRSAHSASGYTGVIAKRDKWQAYITYKGKHYYLGCYTKLEDAVKARSYAKSLVQEDAQTLLALYEDLHKNDPARPSRKTSGKGK